MREASGNREAAGEHSPKRDHTGACVTSDDAANSPGHANTRACRAPLALRPRFPDARAIVCGLIPVSDLMSRDRIA
jgi:hypothetical protein